MKRALNDWDAQHQK